MKSNHSIKAIFFDLDGTLRHSVPSGGDVCSDYVSSLGLHFNPEDRIRATRWEHFYNDCRRKIILDHFGDSGPAVAQE